MTISADIVTPVVDAAPGEAAFGTLRLHNGGSTPATVRVRTVGLDATVSGNGNGNGTHPPSPAAVTVQPGQVCDVPVAIDVPVTLGIGDHAAAFQVVSERVGDRPLLVPFTISVASVERVELTPYPSTIRGRRRANFRLDLVNHEDTPVDVAIEGSAPEVQVRFAQPRVQLLPGQHAVTKGKLKGPRRWSGEQTQHTVVITARGRASATSVTAAYVQRPLFAARLRMITAALVVIALWAGAIGAFAWWWSGRGSDDADQAATSGQIEGLDTDGDGVLDTFFDADGNVVYAIDTDGDGEPDAFFDADGNPVADPREGGGGDGAGGDGDGSGGDGSGDGDGSTSGPRSTVVRGTVTADGDISDVAITMTPIRLGQPAARSGIMGFAAGPAPATQDDGTGDGTIAKIWSARFAAADTGTLNPVRQTEPIRPLETNPEANGLWTFTDVPLRQSYELVFAKPGYQVQSFVITPPEDGSPVELDVELEAAVGAISGRVSGPSGPLGGVAITVTDGSLTFETTSATVGDVGSWSVEGLSTPAVYTVVGELRGYGTEVLQIRLEPGQTLGGANLNMRPGVGSISGRVVGAGGEPLGGVTVTATNGEESRTTSSLTEGNIGFFNIPQLDIPGTYTVSVSHEGYIGQTRRIPVSGAVGGVDFTLLRTTLRLTGHITSSERGQGVANAGLTLSNGELTFKVATAAEPTPGTFVVDDLPPGNYTVTIEHYQHETTTEFITLTAGVTPPPLDVELQWRSGGPEIGTGTLVVEVVDNGADTAERREIKGATVRLVHLQTGEERSVTQQPFDFRIPNLQVGTYLLYVTAPKYNPAPERRVSVGLSEQRVEVSLQRLGQASGRVVDRTDPTKRFDNYLVDIYRLGDARPLLTLPARSDGTWQTQPDSMVPGAYRIVIEDAASPPGYVVHHDQLLDPDAPGATPADKWMVFVIPEGAFEPVVVSDIFADPYPEVTGRVFRSSLVTASGFAEVDHPDLRVTMSCPDGTDFDAELTDEAGVVADDGDPARYETFRITKEQIDANNLTGDCELTAQAAAPLLPVTMALPGVDAGQSTTAPHRRVSLALPVAPPSVGGRVFWRDGTTPVYLQGVTVAGQPVTRYTPIDGTTDITQVPNRVMGALSTTSDANGEWELIGQIAGTTNYTFTADQFAEAVVPFTVDPDGVLTHGAPVGAEVTVTGGRFDVELSDPEPGAGRGTIRIRTTKPNPAFDEVEITAASPVGTVYDEADPDSPIDRDATPSGDTLGFDLLDLQPGTWSVSFTAPDNHAFFEGPPAGSTCAIVDPSTVCQRVQPGALQTGFDASLVELGRLELTLLNYTGSGALAFDPGDLQLSLTGGAHSGAQSGTPANEFLFDEIEVDGTDPVNVAQCYELSLSVAGHDASSAIVSGPSAPECGPAPTGSIAIPVAMFAGSERDYEIRMPRYGTIQGSVVGQVGTATEDVPLTVDRITVTPPAGVDQDDVEVILTGNEFTVSGPAGDYQIAVNHPNFEDVPLIVPADGIDPGLPSGVYRMVNEQDNELDPFVLDIRKGTLDISVVDTLADGNPIDGAIYCLSGVGTPQSGPIDASGQVGQITIPNLVPGTYTLQLRKFFDPDVTTCTGGPPADESAFPTITTVVIGRGTATTPAVTTVRAPLPPLAASLAGTIIAENVDGDPVPLPDSAGTYEVTFSYEPPTVEQDRVGDPTPPAVPPGPGQFLDDDCVALIGDPPAALCTADIDVDAADDGTVGYEFQYMPAGAHEVTLAGSTVSSLAAAGYTLSGSATQTGTRTGEFENEGPDFLFTVQNVQLVIELAPDDQLVEIVPNSVSLTHPDLGAPLQTYSFNPNDNTITFDGVAPRVGSYSLQVAATLHDTLDVDDIEVPVTPGPGPVVRLERHMEPNLARVSGTVQRCDGPNQTVCSGLDADDGGVIELLDAPGATTPFRSSVGPSSFEFDVPPDEYWIRVTQDGYSTALVPVDLTEEAGKHKDDLSLITIEKEATVTVTVGNGTTLTSPISIQLRSVGAGPTNYSPRPGPVGSPPQATFDVPPGDYHVVVSGGNYTEEEIDVPNSSVAVGATANWTVYLDRKIGLSVSDTGTASVTVRLFQNGANLATATPIATQTHTNDERFEFALPYNPASPPSWFTQPLVVQVTASGFRTQVVTTTNALQPAIADVAMARHVEVSGSIVSDESDANKSGTNLVRATSSGVPDILGNVVDGTFTLSGLTNNLVTGGSRVWSISYNKPGVGTSVAQTVTVSAANTVASFDLTPVPQQIEVSVVVTDENDDPVEGASVTVGSGTATEDPDEPGTYVRTVNETFETVTWAASKPGHVSDGGNVPSLTGRTPVSVNASLPSRTITMTVEGAQPGGPNPDLDSGVTFQICRVSIAGMPNSACAATPQSLTVTNLGDGAYSFVAPLPDAPFPARYRVIASHADYNDGALTFVISAAGGLASPNTLAFTLQPD